MSHFSTIKTQIKEIDPLIKSLDLLGFNINHEKKFIKGYKGKVTVKNKTSDAFISNHSENLTQLKNESNVTF